ncbi:hypothetical protein DFJ58DRAFT_426568 [Suillus subalutaceus]|uniref:uncharacterized protein n=1 Tax=Suillus subalutaceus TaxID=48586 RepID=UPI001B8750E6|nr:uncharacterized protein DFJ58DRAFT_426568 [Suillus subalutaceus]KAG1851330.1 hypothetical protein DFJ58DRAFT_426568 [Suillus subalutaceus]
MDYSTFSIRDALGPQVVLQRSSTMTSVVPRDRAFVEQETFLSRNQADAARNLNDVDATSHPTHHSFNTNSQHAHSVSPLLSFQNVSEDYIPTLPGFAIHNTSSTHVYQEHHFLDPSNARITNHQLMLHDSTYPFSEIALAPGEQSSNGDQPIKAASFSRTAGQNHQYDALSLDTTFHHLYLTINDKSEMTHPTSPPFSLDSLDSTRPPWIYQHPVPHHHHPAYPFPLVLLPLADYSSFPGSYAPRRDGRRTSHVSVERSRIRAA